MVKATGVLSECSITSIADLTDIKNSMAVYVENNSLESASIDSLTKLAACIECYQTLRESGRLHCLTSNNNTKK